MPTAECSWQGTPSKKRGQGEGGRLQREATCRSNSCRALGASACQAATFGSASRSPLPACRVAGMTGFRTAFLLGLCQLALASSSNLSSTCSCGDIDDWNDDRFAQCNFWGDPHITNSYGALGSFDFQGIGLFKWAVSSKCGYKFQVNAFTCRFTPRLWSNSIVRYLAIQVGNDIIYVNNTNVGGSGLDLVEGDFSRPTAGINIRSPDQCFRLNVNTKPLDEGQRGVLRKSVSCTSRALSMLSACSQGALSMLSACPQRALSVLSACSQRALTVLSACPQDALSVLSACSQRALSVLSVCSQSVLSACSQSVLSACPQSVLSACSQRALSVLLGCSQRALSVLSGCSQRAHACSQRALRVPSECSQRALRVLSACSQRALVLPQCCLQAGTTT